ncbi:hypothetical protein [Chitinimonas sp. BJB300]|uniref:hypothetical protein n=1 Tax=Chitinimonas sp. BJB300 TaxID=1559339 RepID=UPI000C0D61AA|nr:hypothetical protein [Chitinimonas sp. BJB300]PHV13203.1 hypothetical protein CSQ89_01420 [Chitinimonas sp. BJB300]TSJ89594.1 hypothetical protein FG002_005050 [Chitinimonas sp. BJB300]
MDSTNPNASLAALARCVRVEEGEQQDRLELASAWARLPTDATDRTVGMIAVGVSGILICLLFLQAAVTRTAPTLIMALVALGGAVLIGWYFRAWFWRTAVEVNAVRIRLAMQGWGVPAPVELPIADIHALAYRMDKGRLAVLKIDYSGGSLPIPFSGQRELDKLYCNILLHLLQKRRPEIAFAAVSESA